jgi:hypothetical protein
MKAYIVAEIQRGGWGEVRLSHAASLDCYEAGAAPKRLAGLEVWVHVESGGRAIASRTSVFTPEGSSVWNHHIRKAEAQSILSWTLKQIGAPR